MDETMAYKGSESQEIGRIWDLKGKDEFLKNLWMGLDSYCEDDLESERRLIDLLMTDEMKRIGAYSRQFGGAHYADSQGPFECDIVDIVADGGRGWKYFWKREGHYFQADMTTLIGKAMPAVKESDVSEEFKVQFVIYVSPHLLEVHYAAAAGHYAAVRYGLCLGAYGTGTIGGESLPNQGPFKCIMVGDGGTGKTTYMKQKLTGKFETKYEPTRGMHEHILYVPTKQGSTRFLCVDTPGHEKPGTPRDSYYEGADCCIIFYDITAKQTQKDVSMWHEDVHRVCGDIPMVACGNKVDLKKRQVKTKKVTFHMEKKLQYYEISAKSGYNLDSPFQYLAEKLAG